MDFYEHHYVRLTNFGEVLDDSTVEWFPVHHIDATYNASPASGTASRLCPRAVLLADFPASQGGPRRRAASDREHALGPLIYAIGPTNLPPVVLA